MFLASGTLTFSEDIYFYCDKAGQFTFKASVKSHEWRINKDNNQWVDGKICTFHVSGDGAQIDTKREYNRNLNKCQAKGIVSYFEKGFTGHYCLNVIVSGFNGPFQDLNVQKQIDIHPGTDCCHCFYKFTKNDFKINNYKPERIEYSSAQHLLKLFYSTRTQFPSDAECIQGFYPVDLIKNNQIVKQIKWFQPFNDVPLTENYDKALIKTSFGVITKSPPLMNLSLTDIRKNIDVKINNTELVGKINYSILYPEPETHRWILFSQKKVESVHFPIEVPKISTLNQWKLLFNTEKYFPKECMIPLSSLEIRTSLKKIEPKYVKITLKDKPSELNSFFYIKDNQNMIIFYQQNTNNKFFVPLNEFFNNRAVFCEICSENHVLKKVKIDDLRNKIESGSDNPNVDIELQRY